MIDPHAGAGATTIAVSTASVDRARLVEHLADLGVSVVDLNPPSPRRASIVCGTRTVLLELPERGDSTFWLAGRVRRFERQVVDAADCASPWLGRVLDGPDCQHPLCPPADEDRTETVVLIDPRMRVTARTLQELDTRIAECGYVVAAARRVCGDPLARRRLAHLHYLPHAENAASAALDAVEHARLLSIYDRPEFETRYGSRAVDVEIVPTERFRRQHDVPAEVIEHWSRTSTQRRGLDSGDLDGPNMIGDCLSVNVFHDARYAAGRPFFLVNPHMLEVLGAYEMSECFAIHLRARSSQALSLARLRAEFLGATDPARAKPGSIRADSLAELFPLRAKDGTPVTRWNNGIHMSNGPVEAIRELRIWFDVERRQPPRPGTLLSRPWIDHNGRRRALAELTSGVSRGEVVELIRLGRLTGPVRAPRDVDRERRVVAAWRAAKQLRDDPDVLAVIGLGRGFRDAEVEVLAITRGPSRDDLVVGGVEVARRSLALVEQALTRAGSLAALRSAARIGNGVPLFDPANLAAGFEAKNASLIPPRAFIDALLWRATALLSLAAESPSRATLRRLNHTLAIVLLSLHPLRYDEPRWVLDDLASIGESRLGAALRRCFGRDAAPVHPSENRIARAALARTRARADAIYKCTGVGDLSSTGSESAAAAISGES